MDFNVTFNKQPLTSYATPMKIKVGNYEVSIAADDNFGQDSYTRTYLAIYDQNNECIFETGRVSFQDIVDAVNTAKELQGL